MRIVFDTNIYFAAVRQGFVFELLEKVLDPENGYFLFISQPIFLELSEKLGLAEKEKYLTHENVVYILDTVQTIKMVYPKEKIKAVKSDPDDDKILECAVEAQADLIITMDKHLLKLKVFRRTGIVHPKTFSFMFPR